MKRWPIPLVTVLLMVGISPAAVGQPDFGPEEWHQYRMHNDKNAVFDNDSEPLDYREFETANEVRATPVFAHNTMFIGKHESGKLFAFDVRTGEELWRNEAPNWIHSEMIHHDGTVYVGFGNRYPRDNDIRGTGENGVLALDAETGEIEWKHNTEGEVMPTPTYRDGSVYATTGDHGLYKLDSATGELEHREDLGHAVSMSAPNVTDDSLYVGGGKPEPYTLSSYDLRQDDLDWQTEFPDVFAGLDDVPPAVSDNLVVTTALEGDDTDPEHLVYAMDTETGETVWEDHPRNRRNGGKQQIRCPNH